jgi:hypothetical protein
VEVMYIGAPVGVGVSVSISAGYDGTGTVDVWGDKIVGGRDRSPEDAIGVGYSVVARRTQLHAEEISGGPAVAGTYDGTSMLSFSRYSLQNTGAAWVRLLRASRQSS